MTMDPESLPERLKNEMSVSFGSTDFERVFGSSPSQASLGVMHMRTRARASSLTPSIPPELELPREDRGRVKILLVEDNPVNQSIAIKTIRKLGFTVSAVWNGKEALDYLLAAESENAPHERPDIILMDVQMPIIDGYRATHLIRHHEPYARAASKIPIVAMTASAIQGDREKCERAGMDDYLSKPVKGRVLEKMLVRWAVKGRSFVSTPADSIYDSSECAEAGDRNCGHGRRPSIDCAGAGAIKHADKHSPLSITQNSDTTNPQIEFPDLEHDHSQQGSQKSASGVDLVHGLQAPQVSHEIGHGTSPGQRLTVENIGRLEAIGRSRDRTPVGSLAMDAFAVQRLGLNQGEVCLSISPVNQYPGAYLSASQNSRYTGTTGDGMLDDVKEVDEEEDETLGTSRTETNAIVPPQRIPNRPGMERRLRDSDRTITEVNMH